MMPERLPQPPKDFIQEPSTLTSLQQGNEDTWSSFYTFYLPRWQRFAVKRGVSPEAASDLVSDTVTKLHRRLVGAPYEGNFDAYAWSAFLRSFVSQKRRESRHRIRTVPFEQVVNDEGRVDDGAEMLIDQSPGPEDLVVKNAEIREFHALFRRGFSQISPAHQEALISEAQGIPAEEAGIQLNRSRVSVNVLRHRARKALYTAATQTEAA